MRRFRRKLARHAIFLAVTVKEVPNFAPGVTQIVNFRISLTINASEHVLRATHQLMANAKDVKVHAKTVSTLFLTVSRAMVRQIEDICTQAFAMPFAHLIPHQAQTNQSSLLVSAVLMQLVSFVIQMTRVSVKDVRLGFTYTTINAKVLVQEAGKKTRIAQRASCSQSTTLVLYRSHS